MKRAYYTAVFAGLYGTAGLVFVLCSCAGCGSSARRLPGDRAPSLIVTAPLVPPAVSAPALLEDVKVPGEVAPPSVPDLRAEPAPGAVVQPVGPPLAGPRGG